MPTQAKEFGVPEVWMNERIMRIAPKSFAEFLTAFDEEVRLVVSSADCGVLWPPPFLLLWHAWTAMTGALYRRTHSEAPA